MLPLETMGSLTWVLHSSVAEADYIVLLRYCIKIMHLGDKGTAVKVANNDSSTRVARAQCILFGVGIEGYSLKDCVPYGYARCVL